jgi:cytochrome c2
VPVAALQTSHAIILALVAGSFIAFALVCALVIPRYRPDFPGENGLKPFLIVSVCLFVATLVAIEFFAAEPKEAAANETTTTASTTTGATTAASTTTGATTAASTTTGATTTAPTTTQAAPSAADIAQGKGLYTSLGCVGCHSLDGAKGTGPTFKGLAGSQVMLTDGTTVTADDAYLTRSIDDPDAQIVDGYQPGIMSAVIKKGSVSPDDTKALVAFIDSQK